MSWTSRLKKWRERRRPPADASPALARSFRERQQQEAAFEARERGERTVALERIVGSVGRYHDFDERFRIRAHMPPERLEAIRRKLAEGKPMPPVRLYQIKNEYYVLDGHHRIAALKSLGRQEVRARVVEFVPGEPSLGNLVFREKAAFDDATGLPAEIELTEPGQYAHLERQIERHRRFLAARTGKPPGFTEAAADWYRTIYRPLLAIIEQSGLPRYFPHRTAADLYVYISVHQWESPGPGLRFGVGINQLVPQDMEEFRAKMATLNRGEYPDMLREITVFVLMVVEASREERLIEKLMQLDEVREVHSVHGSVDLIAKIVLKRSLVVSDAETIGDFVHNMIRRLPGVVNTQTLIPGISKVKPAPATGVRS